MSAVKRIEIAPDAATLDLWRVAQNGDVDELTSVLPRVRDIDARNEHGVTALMRAAQYGHLKMVRALLEQGADANVKRNDKFTALALAAFFGHTEIVRALMEHGADSQAATRHNTSPHMWATARTFNKVVDQLEKPAPVKRLVPLEKRAPLERPAPVNTQQVAVPSPAPAVIRTLKDPPEIWDLVHEVPRGFNPRLAFLTRLKSLKTGLAFRMAAIAVLLGAGVVGVMVLRGVQARNEGTAVPVAKQPPETKVRSNTISAESSSQPAVTAPSITAAPTNVPEENSVTGSDQPISTAKQNGRWPRSPRGVRKLPPQAVDTGAVQPVAAAPERTSLEPRAKAPAKTKAMSPLSPQMIAPAKDAGVKGKVIQWP